MPTRSPVPVKISDFTGTGVNIFEYKSGLIDPGFPDSDENFHKMIFFSLTAIKIIYYS